MSLILVDYFYVICCALSINYPRPIINTKELYTSYVDFYKVSR